MGRFPFLNPLTIPCPRLLKESTAVFLSTRCAGSSRGTRLKTLFVSPCMTIKTSRVLREPNHSPFKRTFLGVTISITWHACVLFVFRFILYTRYFTMLRPLLPACEVILLLGCKFIYCHAH